MEILMGKLTPVDKVTEEVDYDFTYSWYDLLHNEINEFYSPLEDWEYSEFSIDFKKLLNWNLGIKRGLNKSQQLDWFLSTTLEIMKIKDIFKLLLENIHDKHCLSLLYNILLVQERKLVMSEELDVLKFLVELLKIDDTDDTFGISKRLLVILKLLGTFVGGEMGLIELKNEKRKM